jgi:hypothetical protein
MGLEHRPYIGSWTMGSRKVIQHTPDALVYINGDMSVPGCVKCNSYINIQEFITSVSVDAGTDAAGASASVTLSVPIHHLDSFARDAQFILRPGLEVHVYQRGYFPVKGMFSNLAGASSPENMDIHSPSGPIQVGKWTGKYSPDNLLSSHEGPLGDLPQEVQNNLWAVCNNMETIDQYFAARAERGDFGSYEPGSMSIHVGDGYATKGHADDSQHYVGNALDFNMQYKDEKGRTHMVPKDDTWAGLIRMQQTDYIEHGGIGSYSKVDAAGNPTGWYVNPHFDRRGLNDDNKDPRWNRRKAPGEKNGTGGFSPTSSMDEAYANSPLPGKLDGVYSYDENEAAKNTTPKVGIASDGAPKQEPNWQPTPLDQMGMSDKDLENLLAYPYYHTFHGVVTQVSFSWSPGTQEITIQCASMLHFWQYHQMSTNASVFGARPHNSKARVSMVGHNFTGMHPYEIMYTLHHDTAGAAGGISWAMSQKTNQKARSSITGESLFSMNLRYWQQRFNQRETKLRLHGVTGMLFNSAQATWLSRKKSGVLTDMIRRRFNLRSDRRGGDILTSSLFEALVWGRSHAGKPKPGSKNPRLELNVIEMEAFVSNISEWGNIQLFESTYESKLDIAQKVCETTGFEFYQDVDGDFVFKPPMYNLDTSSSRAYRIEDIDLISINFDEKEPEVTYMTVKGSGMKNQLGVGLENEWGKKGMYIDYRLVAQYGWRPGNYEAEYFSNKAAMFFAAVNRMDIMNAPVNSASASIPVRPEIRPGYPFYIPYLDCFYYCPSFAHSYQVGGQCTTTLQLIAKRAKFYAPGDPTKGEKGIEAINLGYPSFPPMPLQIEALDGRPRMKGFPNVVMALDPNQLNPTYFMVGADIDLMDTKEALGGLLKMAVDLNVLTTKDKGDPGPVYWMELNDGSQKIDFWYDPEGEIAPPGHADIKTVAMQYQKALVAFQEGQTKITETMMGLMEKVIEADEKLRNVHADPESTPDKVDKALKKAAKARKNLHAEENKFEMTRKAFDTSEDEDFPLKGTFLKLIREVGSRFFSSNQFGAAYGDPDATATMLDMLSDTKAIMTSGDMPGMYRYYSASHPHKEQQGQPPIKITKGAKETVTPFVQGARPVPTFVPSGQLQVLDTSSTPPDAQLMDKVPIWGLRVLTGKEPGSGEFLPTNEIRQLMFGVHQVHLLTRRGTGKYINRKVDLGLGIGKRINGYFWEADDVAWKNDPLGAIPLTFLNSILAKVNKAISGAGTTEHDGSWGFAVKVLETAGYLKAEVPPIQDIGLGDEGKGTAFLYRGVTVDLTKPLSSYKLADNPEGAELMFPGSDRFSALQVWHGLSDEFAKGVTSQVQTVKNNWLQELDKIEGLPMEVRMEALSELLRGFQMAMGGKNRRVRNVRTRKETPWRKNIYSPVFPVSDSQGYEVIGSYRYGRDLDIDPAGVFDVLLRQDPLDLLPSKLREQFVDIIEGKGIVVEKEVEGVKSSTGGAATTKDKVSGVTASSEVERKVIEVLRNNMTDKQILDLGLAGTTADPSVLMLELRNWIADKNKDGLMKIPVINAGYSLGDLQLHTGASICRCKAAEADVLLHVAGEDDFVAVAASGAVLPEAWGDSDLDPITRWEMIAASQAAPAWQQAQEALRGVRPIVNESSIVKAFQNLGETYSDWQDDISKQAETLEAQSEAMYNESTQAIEDSIDAFGEEDE